MVNSVRQMNKIGLLCSDLASDLNRFIDGVMRTVRFVADSIEEKYFDTVEHLLGTGGEPFAVCGIADVADSKACDRCIAVW